MQMMEIGIASYTMKNIVLPGISLALEICPNLGPNVFWVKIRTRGSQPRICVRIFAQFTSWNTGAIWRLRCWVVSCAFGIWGPSRCIMIEHARL